MVSSCSLLRVTSKGCSITVASSGRLCQRTQSCQSWNPGTVASWRQGSFTETCNKASHRRRWPPWDRCRKSPSWWSLPSIRASTRDWKPQYFDSLAETAWVKRNQNQYAWDQTKRVCHSLEHPQQVLDQQVLQPGDLLPHNVAQHHTTNCHEE